MNKKKLNKTNLMLLILFALSLILIIITFLVIIVNTLLGKIPYWICLSFITFMCAGINLYLSYMEIKQYLENKKEK